MPTARAQRPPTSEPKGLGRGLGDSHTLPLGPPTPGLQGQAGQPSQMTGPPFISIPLNPAGFPHSVPVTSAPGEKHLSSLLTHSNALPFSSGVCPHGNVPYLAGSRKAEIRVAVRYGGHLLTRPSDVGSEDISYLFLKGLQLLGRKYYLIIRFCGCCHCRRKDLELDLF